MPQPQLNKPDFYKNIINWVFPEINKYDYEDICLHKNCSECHGTGRKHNGQPCIHMLSCKCKRCSPYYL